MIFVTAFVWEFSIYSVFLSSLSFLYLILLEPIVSIILILNEA